MILDIWTILLRFTITFLLSFLFGIERQKSHKPIGFGTFIFVSVGSCALAITSVILGNDNPLPLLGAIVTGIGFLGAGALIKTSDKIFGFTSAATIWIFAIFGLLIGVGEYFVGMAVYVLIWIVVLYDRNLEKRGEGSYQKKLIVVTNKIIKEKELKELLMLCLTKYNLTVFEVDKKNSKITFQYIIEGTKEQMNKLPKILYEKPWFESCKIE
jgi:uncharacterized membrane protein YhiD involved in acid resistance